MQKTEAPTSPDAYAGGLGGWRGECVRALRAAVRGAASFEEVIKWGHLVYMSDGPAVLIRAEAERVLLGFWRGRRLKAIEPRLQTGGKYEMARLVLRGDDTLDPQVVSRLAAEAHRLNTELGDPTKSGG